MPLPGDVAPESWALAAEHADDARQLHGGQPPDEVVQNLWLPAVVCAA